MIYVSVRVSGYYKELAQVKHDLDTAQINIGTVSDGLAELFSSRNSFFFENETEPATIRL